MACENFEVTADSVKSLSGEMLFQVRLCLSAEQRQSQEAGDMDTVVKYGAAIEVIDAEIHRDMQNLLGKLGKITEETVKEIQNKQIAMAKVMHTVREKTQKLKNANELLGSIVHIVDNITDFLVTRKG